MPCIFSSCKIAQTFIDMLFYRHCWVDGNTETSSSTGNGYVWPLNFERVYTYLETVSFVGNYQNCGFWKDYLLTFNLNAFLLFQFGHFPLGTQLRSSLSRSFASQRSRRKKDVTKISKNETFQQRCHKMTSIGRLFETRHI